MTKITILADTTPIDETIAYVELWYNRAERAWVIQTKNAEGYQIGEAVYMTGRSLSFAAARQIAADHGVQIRDFRQHRA